MSMSDQFAIKTQGLTKAYGQVQALRGVDLEVRRGEIFGFLGPNGAGKTTTIRCLLDLIRPQAGTIRVLGLDPQADSVAVRARTGYLPGELNLEANLRVEAALRYLNDLRGNKADWTYVQQLADGLELDLTMPIKNLSKGNKQKVGVVQALMSRPELLLLDEPTSGLDPLMQQAVYRLLREARTAGATIFFSSHIISEVESDRRPGGHHPGRGDRRGGRACPPGRYNHAPRADTLQAAGGSWPSGQCARCVAAVAKQRPQRHAASRG